MNWENKQQGESFWEGKTDSPGVKIWSDVIRSGTNKVSTDNIFAELSWELNFWKEKEVIWVQVKDSEYYLKLTGTILFFLNIFLGIVTFIWVAFVKIENNDSLYSRSFLDPVCNFILSESIKNTWESCSSISALLKDYTSKTIDIKKKTVDKLSSIIETAYTIENFSNSKEIVFLMENKSKRLNILNILNDFDNLKNDFSWLDKEMIHCSTITIKDDSILETSCDINSSSWELANEAGKGIIWYNGDTSSFIEGSSISIAASFLNFIEKNSKYNFQLLEKQKDFSSSFITWNGNYIKTTNIKLQLKYNNLKNNLSL